MGSGFPPDAGENAESADTMVISRDNCTIQRCFARTPNHIVEIMRIA